MSLITAGADINHQNQVEIHMYMYIYMCTCTLYVIKYTKLFLLYYNTHVLSQHMK